MLLRIVVAMVSLFSCLVAGEGGAMRIACVGDSITEGTVLKDRDKSSYPAALGARLGGGCEVRNFGRSGATVSSGATGYAELPQCQAALAYRPQMVLIMLGTNDTKPAVWQKGAQAFPQRYRQLIDVFRALPDHPEVVAVLPPPVMGAGRFGINEAGRAEVARLIAAVAKEAGLPVIDPGPALRSHPEWFPDLVHPDAAGSGALAQAIAEGLNQVRNRGVRR